MAKERKVKSLPENLALDTEQQKDFHTKVKKTKGKADVRGVIYVGHIPHGFLESQMKGYFGQFGTVSRLRIARSKRTGKPKGYAFVEFRSDAVAKIVADCMNNYLMFHRLLRCQLMPLSKVHPATFKGSGRKFLQPKAHYIAKDRHNSTKSEKQQELALKRMKAKKVKGMAKLAAMGIEYEYPALFTKEDVQKAIEMEAEKKTADSDQPVDMETLSEEATELLYGATSSDDENKDSPDISEGSEESEEEVTVPSPRLTRSRGAKTNTKKKPEKVVTPVKKTLSKKRKVAAMKGNAKKSKK